MRQLLIRQDPRYDLQVIPLLVSSTGFSLSVDLFMGASWLCLPPTHIAQNDGQYSALQNVSSEEKSGGARGFLTRNQPA